MSEVSIVRLDPSHARAIVECFQRVYGDTYANERFYDEGALAQALQSGRLRSVGALRDDVIVAHMALTATHPHASTTELGNTVVDPTQRGGGLAWQVGAALTGWARELGFSAFVHFPTTDHHIMQRQSVERGHETGLMLGYIPPETDAKVRTGARTLRGSATIVYEPLAPQGYRTTTRFCPASSTRSSASSQPTAGTPRDWRTPEGPASGDTAAELTRLERRALARLEINQVGEDVAESIAALRAGRAACQQIDLHMHDAGIQLAVDAALAHGFAFCGWLPGYASSDVLRLQWIDAIATDMHPGVINPIAQRLLTLIAPALSPMNA